MAALPQPYNQLGLSTLKNIFGTADMNLLRAGTNNIPSALTAVGWPGSTGAVSMLAFEKIDFQVVYPQQTEYSGVNPNDDTYYYYGLNIYSKVFNFGNPAGGIYGDGTSSLTNGQIQEISWSWDLTNNYWAGLGYIGGRFYYLINGYHANSGWTTLVVADEYGNSVSYNRSNMDYFSNGTSYAGWRSVIDGGGTQGTILYSPTSYLAIT
jgi:hypothetical protein